MQRTLGVLLVGAVLGFSPALYAEDEALPSPDEETLNQAQALLSEANAHYAAKRYDEARAAYQAAYDLTEAPGFLYNIAQSHRLAGQCREAIEFYEKFLSMDPKTTLRAKVEEFVAEMWTCLDAEKKARQEEEKNASAAAGQSTLAAGGTASADESTLVVSGPASGTSSEGPSRLPLVGLGIAGVGVLALGSAAYFGLSARSTSQEIESFTGTWGPAQESDEQQAQRQERFAIILGIGGTAALAGGIATYLLTRNPNTPGLALVPAEGGLLLSYSELL
jgi:tetratricopeptide (TPR) repeat protein